MGDYDEFPLSVRIFLRAYRWRRIDPVPFAPLRKPLREARIALISSAGFVRPDQPPFDAHIRGGDTSFRAIDATENVNNLINTHRSESFDPGGIEADANVAFPLDRMRELAAAGEIGALAPRTISFMGSITAPGRLVVQTAPAIAGMLQDDRADAALLVPI
ncbi:MAG TPA: glycine/sarcosine/betaine reductase selenoprotein B family protein [Thermoanaerobaculia bacterium]|jgi:D-proline reductase (dithiol) PrdB